MGHLCSCCVSFFVWMRRRPQTSGFGSGQQWRTTSVAAPWRLSLEAIVEMDFFLVVCVEWEFRCVLVCLVASLLAVKKQKHGEKKHICSDVVFLVLVTYNTKIPQVCWPHTFDNLSSRKDSWDYMATVATAIVQYSGQAKNLHKKALPLCVVGLFCYRASRTL